jgi:hypothetical protein
VRVAAGHGCDGDDGAARGHERARLVDAGIAHEPVEPAEAGDGVADGAGRAVCRAHVGVQWQRLSAERLELSTETVEPCRGRKVHGGDLAGAALGLGVASQPQARRPSDPARRPGHEHSHVVL